MGAVEYAVIGFAFIGVLLLLLLCKKMPRLHRSGRSATSIPHTAENYARVSVIIPTYNSAQELPALLADLHNQSLEPVDIVCVDMQSTDDTGIVARRLGAKVVSFRPTASNPSWGSRMQAFQQGVRQSSGDYFLFFKPNLRLAPETVASLVSAYRKNGMPLSLRPYHMIRRNYEHIALYVYLFGAFIKGIGLPGDRRNKDCSFYEDALVFSRYHWELFTAEDSRVREIPFEDNTVPIKVHGQDCTSLQVAVAMLPPEYDQFRNSIIANKSSADFDEVYRHQPEVAFSSTAAAGYSVDTDELFSFEESESEKVARYHGNSYEWMRNRFAEQKMSLRVMLGGRLLRCRNQPDGFGSFLHSMFARVAEDRSGSSSSMRAFVNACLIALFASVFAIILGVTSQYPWLAFAGIVTYSIIALITYSKSRFIGGYHPLAYLLFPISLLFYGFCTITSAFTAKNKREKGENAPQRPTVSP